MLNDLARFARTSVLLQMLAPGFVTGGLLGAFLFPLNDEVGRGELGLMLVAFLAIPGWAVWHVVTVRRMERRFWAEVVAGSQELVEGAVVAVPVPARVVRGRTKPALPAFGLAGGRVPGAAVGLVVTAVGDGPARRVGLLAPAGVVLPPGAPLLVAVHPERAEVAVLEDRVSAGEVAATVGDPRWEQPLPTDRRVIGGWSGIVGFAVLGLLAGAALGFVCARLLVV
ncbi:MULTISPECIES: hypothetical protein [unclassified Nocardioides]|uniref:hypothetical protein n=1 Tax=unclassified Nocardioides TaxID=2615069 RepID=UPI003014E762